MVVWIAAVHQTEGRNLWIRHATNKVHQGELFSLLAHHRIRVVCKEEGLDQMPIIENETPDQERSRESSREVKRERSNMRRVQEQRRKKRRRKKEVQGIQRCRAKGGDDGGWRRKMRGECE